jgi:hypothetical protein
MARIALLVAIARALVFAVAPAQPRAPSLRGSVAFALTVAALAAAIATAVLSGVPVTATTAAAMAVTVVAAIAPLLVAQGRQKAVED